MALLTHLAPAAAKVRGHPVALRFNNIYLLSAEWVKSFVDIATLDLWYTFPGVVIVTFFCTAMLVVIQLSVPAYLSITFHIWYSIHIEMRPPSMVRMDKMNMPPIPGKFILSSIWNSYGTLNGKLWETSGISVIRSKTYGFLLVKSGAAVSSDSYAGFDSSAEAFRWIEVYHAI